MKQQNQQFNSRSQRLRIFVVLIFLPLFFGSISSSCTRSEPKSETVLPTLQTSDQIIETMADDMKGVDFTVFKHDSKQHSQLTCLLCHERKDDSPKPKFASHATCSSCHAVQIMDKNNAICLNCHTNNESGELKEFPPLKSFNAQFNHQTHFKEANCATCHKGEGGGGMTIPSGADAHASCFQCHTSEKMVAEKNIGACATCHQAGTPDRIVDSAKNIGFSFDHGKHSGLNCNSCHNSTGDNQMSAINIGMHKATTNNCATCHNEKNAFGANDFSDCRKCHQEIAGAKVFGVNFEHTNHSKTNCAMCHKSTGKGVNFSIPNGQNAHTTCFECHSPMKPGSKMSNSYCFSCHQAGNPDKIAASKSLIAGNFTHTKHKSMNCNSCHNPKGNGVSAPSVAMHKTSKNVQSCATCHDDKRAFGGDDFSDCKRCHTSNNFKF